MSNFSQRVAKQFVARSESQGMKGKARDRAAVEFFCGAAAAVVGSEEQSGALFTAFLVSARGYSEVERFAKEAA